VATTQKIINSVQELLEQELEDPNKERSGSSNWIYKIPINFGPAQYPRIHIRQGNNSHNSLSIGSTQRFMESRIRINVFNSVNGKFDVDDDGEKERSQYVLDYYKEKIIDLINDNQNRWRNVEDCHVWSVLTVSDEPFNTSKNSVVAHRVDAVIRRRK